MGARAPVEKQTGQQQPKSPGPGLREFILRPGRMNGLQGKCQNCSERATQELRTSLENPAPSLKDLKQINLASGAMTRGLLSVRQARAGAGTAGLPAGGGAVGGEVCSGTRTSTEWPSHGRSVAWRCQRKARDEAEPETGGAGMA